MRYEAGIAIVIVLALLIVGLSITNADMDIVFFWDKANGTITFTTNINGSNYTWNFGDGSIAYGKIVTHKYDNEGTYNVSLTIDGVEKNEIINTLDDPPNPDFYWYPEYPYSYDMVAFWDNSTDTDGHIVNWSWDFENNGKIDAYGKYVTHFYETPGKHNVTLRVIDNYGRIAGITKQIYVLNILPYPKFYWTKIGDSILFNASMSYDLDGYIKNYTWNFGDGSIAYGKIVTHKYVHRGKYNVTLTITDDFGGVNTTSMTVNTLNKLPHADFYWTPSMPTDLDFVNFYSTSWDSDGIIINYTWNFGDGSIAYGRNVSHKYNENGVYYVSLTVYDDDNSYNMTTKEIVIYNVPPVVNFSYYPIYPIPNMNISFNSTSYDLDGYIKNYTWNFGDGSIAYGRNVSHKYTAHGIYNVTLTVIDDDNANASKKIKLVIADFYVNKTIYDPVNHTWKKIQDAVDNATSGSFIYVMDGLYEESVYVNKSLFFLGKNAQVSGNQFSFYFDADNIDIKNFSIKNSINGIIMKSNYSNIENCNFYGNDISINISGKYNTILNNDISGNIAVLLNGSHNFIENNAIDALNYGIKIESNENEINYNDVKGIYGIDIGGIGNEIMNNHIHDCHFGLNAQATSNIEKNTIDENYYGIYSQSYVIVGNNLIKHNEYGIRVKKAEIFNISLIDNNKSFYGENITFYNSYIYGGSGFAGALHFYNGLINSSETSVGYGYFKNSIIENCNDGINGSVYAINVTFIKNYRGAIASGNFENCDFINNYYGIVGDLLLVKNCSFNLNNYALYLRNDSLIENCSFNGNEHALFIDGNGNRMEGNEIHGNDYGIEIYYSRNNSIGKNKIYENEHGLIISFSNKNKIYNNSFYNNTYNIDIQGNEIKYFYNYMDENNRVNGFPTIYIINGSNVLLNKKYGFAAIIGSKNITLSNQEIRNNGKAVIIVSSSKIKVNGIFYYNFNGIYILKSRNIFISNSSIFSNVFGISLTSSYNNSLEDCNIFNNSMIGLKLFDIQKIDSNNSIKNCNFYGNSIGITIQNMGGNKIYGKIGTIKIDDSNNNLFNGTINNFILRNGEIHIENSTIYFGDITISNIKIEKSLIHDLNLEKSSLNGYKNIFHGYIKLNNSSISLYKNNFNNSNLMILNSTIFINENQFYNNTQLKINYSSGNISKCIFYENKFAIELNAENVTLWNSSFYNNSVAIYVLKGIIKRGYVYNNTYGCILNGSVKITKILFHHNLNALILNSSYATIYECSFWKNFYGIIANGMGNKIYHNNFVYNIRNAIDNSNNTWNLSYPYGGNYWDDYAGVDEKHGKRQNESGSDGIGDIPYEIDGSKDFYPLMEFYKNASKIPNKAPIASFRFYPQKPYSFEEIVFIDESDDLNGKSDIISWHWDFGDGSASNERNPIHKYSKPGRYNVTLIVKDRSGDEGKIESYINVSNVPPFANFTYTPKNASSYTIIFLNSLSYDKDGYITNYTWNFGDGGIAYGINVSHIYTQPGIYKVKLIVKDNLNESSSITKDLLIRNKAPSADFDFYPEEPKAGDEISFSDLSTDVDGNIISWHWDFGDGSASNERNPIHKYSKPGRYNVTLIVKDDNGGYASFDKIIEVKGKETPGMEFLLLLIAIALIIWGRRKFK